MVQEKWLVHGKKADFEGFAKELLISPIVARIMRNKDMDTVDKQRAFLDVSIENLHAPNLMKDMDKAMSVIMEKIGEGKHIRIIGDYDIDGICATYILITGITKLGGKVTYDIPDRVKDGYGINESIIKKAYDDGVDTIITCDNGIAAIEPIYYAKSLGMTVVVTDHHEVPYDIDDETGKIIYKRVAADAVVNPKQPDCNYPFKYLCGGAIAYKLVEYLHTMFLQNEWEELRDNLIELAAIATIGDVVDLVGENRIIAAQGLRNLKNTLNMGLDSLMNLCGVNRERLSAYHVGFVIGPCLNAAGRLETAKKGLELLLCDESARAEALAAELVELNNTRKVMTEQGVDIAVSMAGKEVSKKVLLLYVPQIHESIAGIVAGRVREHFNKPVFVITDSADTDENNIVKGSGRSIEGYNMFEELTKCSHLLSKYGGHEMAAGLSFEKNKMDELAKRLNEVCTLTDEDLIRKIWIDVPMPLAYATKEIVEELGRLEPYGKGNEKPVFATKNVSIKALKIIGADQNMCKMQLDDGSGKIMDAIVFKSIFQGFMEFLTEKFGEEEVRKARMSLSNDIRISVIYYPDINEYNGRESMQIIVNNYC